MITAILRKAEASGFRVARGDLGPHDRQVPLASILDLARTVRGAEAFGTLAAELEASQGLRGGDNLGSRQVVVHEVADRLIGAIDRPTVLAFDDLQWADELSLEVIAELARLRRSVPLLVVGAYRLDELPTASLHREWRSRLLSQRLAEEARLRPLTREETALVVTLILATGLPAPREVVNAVYERTDGIPLHVEELLAALDDQARMDGRAIREAHVPDTIEDAILARVARLSPEAREVARAGAVIGRCFTPDVLAGCTDRPIADLDGPLAELVEQAFLYPFDFLDRGFYDFRHALLRDALYGTIPPSELRRLHARAGEFGALLSEGSTIHASVHFERAGRRAEAYRAALTGARAASAVSSRREAFELYARAAANLPDDLPPTEAAALYAGYCEAALAIDNVPVIEETARTARRHYQDAGMALEAADMLVVLATSARRDVRPATERRRLLEAGGYGARAAAAGPGPGPLALRRAAHAGDAPRRRRAATRRPCRPSRRRVPCAARRATRIPGTSTTARHRSPCSGAGWHRGSTRCSTWRDTRAPRAGRAPASPPSAGPPPPRRASWRTTWPWSAWTRACAMPPRSSSRTAAT